MKLFIIATLMAIVGMLATSGVLALAGVEDYETDTNTAVALSDEELDAYISELIDQQFAEVLRQRLDGERSGVATASTN